MLSVLIGAAQWRNRRSSRISARCIAGGCLIGLLPVDLSVAVPEPRPSGACSRAWWIFASAASAASREKLISRVVAGGQPDEPLLEHWRYRQTAPQKWVRSYRGPWDSASEMMRRWRLVTAAVGLTGRVPYALRHSSIVGAIRSGLPIRLVAALHATSVVMIERHYSRWITEGLEELAAKAVVPLLAA